MGNRVCEIDSEIPIDRSQWFRQRAFEVAGSCVFEAYGIEREAASLRDVALIAAVALGVAHYHTSGVPLGELIEWTQERLGIDTDRAFSLTQSAYGHFRQGEGVPGLVWTPAPVYRGMLTWLESQQSTTETPSEACTRIAEAWSLGENGASEIQRDAQNWDRPGGEPFALRHADLRAFAGHLSVRAALDRLSAIGRTSRPIRALVHDLAIVGILQDDANWASQIGELLTDVEQRFDALTAMEKALLTPASVPPAVLGWAEHRNSIFHVNELRVNGRTAMVLSNAVCEKVEEASLIPDWLEQDVFNGRYIAGTARGGPTATVWILPSHVDDLSTLQLDIDLKPRTEGQSGPPAISVCWRDATRAANDWSSVSLLIRDDPESWSWLAVLVITRRMKIDVLAVDSNGDLQIVGGVVATLDEDFFNPWLDRFPDPPAYVAQALKGITEGHIVGGLQAAERSKSYDILELSVDEAADPELLEARRDVLKAESERAERIWGLREAGETEVDRCWGRFRELRAWRHGKNLDTSIDPEAWLSDLTGGIATETRAIVHMMVKDGDLTLFWAAGDGTRRAAVATSAPVHRLLAALEPWTCNVSLRPSDDADPVADMMTEAAPVADAIWELAREQHLDHLVLVPWRGLHCVPWAALNLTDGTPMRDCVRITHAPAIRMLRRSIDHPVGVGAAVAIAAHGNTLPRADAEIELIATIRGAALVRDGASSDEIVRMMSAATVVHIAGHAESGPHPFAAALLAGALPLDPSQITASARIHADADLSQCQLIMINTCNSGRYAPPPRTFENHTGLDTACLCAGAAVVISTLWPVNDLVATIVAAVTHWHLAAGLSPHRSLDAAIAILRDGQGSSGVPAELQSSLDARLDSSWRRQLDGGVAVLRHPYWWAAWRISGADWLLD
jgi:CHAT domain-containing protein